ncbi:MAG: universal stress protein [Candidatus Accumulibacter sp.]|nr:universal stress protein [Accumulibacter sp.]
MSHPVDLPAAAGGQRDADGRLVGLVFDSSPPLTAPTDNPWLVAVDSSDNALRAVAHAARQASTMTACALHLVSVQPWLSREAAAAELAQRAWHSTERARSLLDAHGEPWRLHVAMGEAAEQIAALAGRLGCSVIVIGGRGLGFSEGLLRAAVVNKLVHLCPCPLLLVP